MVIIGLQSFKDYYVNGFIKEFQEYTKYTSNIPIAGKERHYMRDRKYLELFSMLLDKEYFKETGGN